MIDRIDLSETHVGIVPARPAHRLLPDSGLVITGLNYHGASDFEYVDVDLLKNRDIIFLDYSYDPIRLSDADLLEHRARLEEKVGRSDSVTILSGRAEHFFQQLPGIVWYPYFLLLTYTGQASDQRCKRVGCLNRRHTPHRIALMHDLIQQQLIDHERDIFSVMWQTDLYDAHLRYPKCFFADRQLDLDAFPEQEATVDDGFPNDYSTNHPAWNTALCIVTETEPGDRELVTEKTAKALFSKSCFMMYSGPRHMELLHQLGFQSCFDQHAHVTHYGCILDLCKNIKTFDQAMDYRSTRLGEIQWNHEHFVNATWLELYKNSHGDRLQIVQ